MPKRQRVYRKNRITSYARPLDRKFYRRFAIPQQTANIIENAALRRSQFISPPPTHPLYIIFITIAQFHFFNISFAIYKPSKR